MRHSSIGIALKLGATLAFSLMYVFIKLAGRVPVGEVAFFRGFFALLPLLAVSFFTHGPRAMVRTTRPWLHVRRSLTGTASLFLNFAAVTRLPLADVTAFSFVMPIFATVLAALLLGETVGPHRAGAVVLGFGGVLLMVEPHGVFGASFGSASSIGAAAALSGALLSAFVVVFIRQMSATETSEAIVFYFMTICTAVGAVTMLWDYAPLTPIQAVWLILCGVLGGIGQVCMTYSYRYAPPSLLAPFDYVAMVWAVAFGFVFWGDVPGLGLIVGSAIVVASALFLLWYEARSRR